MKLSFFFLALSVFLVVTLTKEVEEDDDLEFRDEGNDGEEFEDMNDPPMDIEKQTNEDEEGEEEIGKEQEQQQDENDIRTDDIEDPDKRYSDNLDDNDDENIDNEDEYEKQDEQDPAASKKRPNTHGGPLTENEVNEMHHYKGEEGKLSKNTKGKRGAGRGIKLWPVGKGRMVIPYTISSRFSVSLRNRIRKIIGIMNGHIKCNANAWRPRHRQKYYVQFVTGNGCSSQVGFKPSGWWLWKKAQKIVLHPDCIKWNYGIVLHEMLHAMGFWHEQSRSDRDNYVQILYQNVQGGKRHNFNKKNTNSLGTAYDYGSVMHYSATAFSKNGKRTIQSKKPLNGKVMGQRNGLSSNDRYELNKLYRCYSPPPSRRRRRRRRRRRIWGKKDAKKYHQQKDA